MPYYVETKKGDIQEVDKYSTTGRAAPGTYLYQLIGMNFKGTPDEYKKADGAVQWVNYCISVGSCPKHMLINGDKKIVVMFNQIRSFWSEKD